MELINAIFARFRKVLTPSCQSGRNAGLLAGAFAIAAAPAALASQVGWAHQAAGFQSNGSVTVKSLAGGSYAGTQNPTGAVAKPNQLASTQGPTVIIQATGSGIQFASTQAVYTGNLGGVSGADAKCVAEFGAGWKFATYGRFIGVPITTITSAWIQSDLTNTCSGWTVASTSFTGGLIQNYSSGAGNIWRAFGSGCAQSFPIMCMQG